MHRQGRRLWAVAAAVLLLLGGCGERRPLSRGEEVPSQEASLPPEEEASSLPSSSTEEEPAQEAPAGEQSPQKDSQEQPMATVEAEGREYLGELRFPTLDLTLPVLSQCGEENLKTAPCRYQGSLSGGDLIVAGHNYQSHFGRLDQLSPGDPVTFTGPDGETYAFEVTETQELPGTALEEMEAGEWDLTLFTCTLDGRGRITLRCQRTE